MSARPKASDSHAPSTGASALSDAVPIRTGLLADHHFVEARFGGSGGQGVVLMGIILATAANYDRRCVVQTESYGPEARGGYSRSDVIISDQPIDYPKIDHYDLLVALSQDSAIGYVKNLRREGILIYESDKVTNLPAFNGTKVGAPFTRWAQEETGRIQAANVVALGAVVAVTGIVSAESLQRAVAEAVPAGTQEANLRALARGLALEPAQEGNAPS